MKKSRKEKQEEQLHRIPLRITDTTLRDAHQSLWATRMRTDDILGIIDRIDAAGFYSLEVWGGATFDVCLRFLRENPWERLRQVKARAKNTPLQMLLRGQNLVGYRNYADDVVDRFVALACEYGIDIFRIFDALNDTRNLEAAVRAVKKHGGHAQGTLSYTISPVHTVEKYVEYAREQVALGIDSLCIKDMAGILSPIAAERLVSALIEAVDVPIQLHCHASSGMATATYVDGVRAGAGAIDCCVSTMAGFSAQPPVEALVAIFSETNYHATIDLEVLTDIAKYFADLTPRRMQDRSRKFVIDPQILIHQIPGGMISNFRSQLDQQKALDKLPEVLEEVSRVRADLGWPPLVTPTSQIVGTQAVMNVIAGERYKIVPNEVKNYVRGLYGRPPGPIAASFTRKILGRGVKPVTHRPADALEPMLPHATDDVDPRLIENEEDIISYVLYPQQALDYFTWRRQPAEQRSEIPADREWRELMEKERPRGPAGDGSRTLPQPPKPRGSGKLEQILHSNDYAGLSKMLGSLSGVPIEEVTMRRGDFSLTLRGGKGLTPGSVTEQTGPREPVEEESAPALPADTEEPRSVEEPAPGDAAVSGDADRTIDSPLTGTFYRSAGPGKSAFVKEGDTVNAGDKVCMVEAMKLFNEIEAPCRCRILKFMHAEGTAVEKNSPLIAVQKL